MINSEFVEKLQIEFERNPNSRVFAPLAEAYRKMGLIDEARQISERGVELHPDFVSGRVALARILIDQKKYERAKQHLDMAVRISPDNLLGYSMLGQVLLELRRPREALAAYKMVLFLNPSDEKAQAIVRKWEFMTADDYQPEMFADPSPPDVNDEATRVVERAVSLADAFTVRNDVEKAMRVLEEAQMTAGDHPELNHRLKLLERRGISRDESFADSRIQKKRKFLEDLLRKVERRSKVDQSR